MILVDARGLPMAVTTGSASPHQSTLVHGLFDFMLTIEDPRSDMPDDDLAHRGLEMIGPHRRSRKRENITQDGRPVCRYNRRCAVERTISRFQPFRCLCIRYEKSNMFFQGFLHLGYSIILRKQVYG